MIIRKTTVSDIKDVASIYESARKFMHANGNPHQWIGYPSETDIVSDINSSCSYVVTDKNEIVGVFYFHVGDDETYLKIDDGEWINDEPYGVIHRIAIKYHGQGIADFIYNYCFNIQQNLRIDTHRDNAPMQKSLMKNGFKYCGIIHIRNGEERLAYQKTNC